MSARDRAVGLFADTGEVCADSGVLPEAVEALNARLGGRMRLVLRGGAPCDRANGFDRHGQCNRCGRRMERSEHKPGCSPLALVAVARIRLVRLLRLARSHGSTLRGRS